MRATRYVDRILSIAGATLAFGLLLMLLAPLFSLLVTVDLDDIERAWGHPLFIPAVNLSLSTSCTSIIAIIFGGTPLAWWLSRSSSLGRRIVGGIVGLPIVLPPAVAGLALLLLFGRRGLIGAQLSEWDVELAFTSYAVVIAQVVVAAPFYIRAATAAFQSIDEEMLLVARTLGASPWATVYKVVLPTVQPGLFAGASLAWARALGEFGATLVFAGSLPGETLTMPLAILAALETEVRLAVVFALALTAVALLVLILLQRSRDTRSVTL